LYFSRKCLASWIFCRTVTFSSLIFTKRKSENFSKQSELTWSCVGIVEAASSNPVPSTCTKKWQTNQPLLLPESYYHLLPKYKEFLKSKSELASIEVKICGEALTEMHWLVKKIINTRYWFNTNHKILYLMVPLAYVLWVGIVITVLFL